MKIFGFKKNDTTIKITIFNKNFLIKTSDDLYETILKSWSSGCNSDELILLLNFLYYNQKFWIEKYRKIWLIYISCLCERNDEKKALKVLKKYQALFQCKDIETILSVAAFAVKNNIYNDNILISANLYNVLEESRINNSFANYIKNKSIAVVGNGTQLNNSGKGKEIDSHDIVIRFNQFRTKGFEEDCGKKTNIWVTIDNYEKQCEHIDYTIFNIEYRNNFVDPKKLSGAFDNSDNIGVLSMEDLGYAHDCLLNDFYKPTTGCLTILALYRILGKFDNIDFYGFGFLNQEFKPLDHYYAKVSKRHQEKAEEMHNFRQESIFLKKLILHDTFVQ